MGVQEAGMDEDEQEQEGCAQPCRGILHLLLSQVPRCLVRVTSVTLSQLLTRIYFPKKTT